MKLNHTLPVFQGFYGTIFSFNDEDQYIEEGRTWDNYNWDYADYQKRVSEKCVEAIEHEIKDYFKVDIKFEGLYSPKHYNYSNDQINVEYDFDDSVVIPEIINYLELEKEAFKKWVKERHSSRSGYMSLISNDSTEWIRILNEEKDHEKFAAMFADVLEFVFHTEVFGADDLLSAVSSENWINYELKSQIK